MKCCSFTIQQGDTKEWQQWAEIPAKEAANKLWLLIKYHLNLIEPISFFTTTNTGGDSGTFNQISKIPPKDAIFMLIRLARQWEEDSG